MNNLHIVTVVSESKYYFPYLVESCKRNGKELEVLGYDDKWGKGNMTKFKLMIDYLKNLPKDDIVCFVDGFDVICCRDLSELKDEFLKIHRQTHCKIIIGNDIKSDFNNFFAKFTFEKCNNYLINSGLYIGYASDLLEIILNIYNLFKDKTVSDQDALTQYCNMSNINNFYIDSKNELFCNIMASLDDISKYVNIDQKNNILIYNSNKPFFIHAPGFGYLDTIIRKLGYNISVEESNKIRKQILNNVIKKNIPFILIGIKKNILYIIAFIILIVLIIYICRNYKKIFKKLKYKNIKYKK